MNILIIFSITLMRRLLKILVIVGCGLLSGPVLAANLLEVYNQALVSDPAFQVARAQWLSDREKIAISRSELLPWFDISGLAGRGVTNNTYNALGMVPSLSHKNKYYDNRAQYALNLDQPLFNYQAWAAVASAKSFVKGSAAQYGGAALDLINRTASAYLAVLEASDVLRYTEAEKKYTASQLEETRERYKVGLETITELDQVQAQYDSVVSQEISNANDLAVKKEQLREITGQHYKSFAKLSRKLPLVTPNPEDITQWVSVAQQQNYDLLTARYNLQAAQENIKAQSAGRYPTLDLQGGMAQQYDNNNNGSGQDNTNTTAMAGLSLNFPVVQGGLVGAQTRQAKYDYENASSTLEKTDRSVVSETRQAYLTVMSDISEVKANQQAVISARSSLASTEESYKVGTSTMVDVLNELSNLYEAEKNYTTSQYSYLIQTLALKQAAGTLSINDIQTINSWLQPVPKVTKAKITKAKPKKPVKRVKKVKKTTYKGMEKTHAVNIKLQKQEKAYERMLEEIEEKNKFKKVNKTTYKVTTDCKSRNATVSEKHLLSIDSNHYTIQLVDAKHGKTLVNFMNRYRVPGKVYSYTTYHNGQKLYMLILGDYPTLKQAHSTIHQLPANIKAQHPWARSYRSVQKDIRLGVCKDL